MKLKELSYSSLLNLHACPRKFELDKLTNAEDYEDTENVDFAFGHAVGVGIQSVLLNLSYEQVIIEMFKAWDCDFELTKKKKSFPYAVQAIDKFIELRPLLFNGWEVAEFNGKPAIELSAKIEMPDGYAYRMFMDAVLYNPELNEFMVLENKTTSFNAIDPAMYQNSNQALGYSVILDAIAASYHRPVLSSYKVMYLVYKTGSGEWEHMPFEKTKVDRATFLNDLMIDVDIIELYKKTGYFPKHGESCYNFFRQCPYFGVCNLSNSVLGVTQNKESEDKEFMFTFDLVNLIDIQLKDL